MLGNHRGRYRSLCFTNHLAESLASKAEDHIPELKCVENCTTKLLNYQPDSSSATEDSSLAGGASDLMIGAFENAMAHIPITSFPPPGIGMPAIISPFRLHY